MALALEQALPPLMQVGVMIPSGVAVGVQMARYVGREPNGIWDNHPYVIAAHDWIFGTKFWSFRTAAEAWHFFDHGFTLLRRVLVQRTGPVDYQELGRNGEAPLFWNWVDAAIFHDLNLRIATPRPPLVPHEAYLLA